MLKVQGHEKGVEKSKNIANFERLCLIELSSKIILLATIVKEMTPAIFFFFKLIS